MESPLVLRELVAWRRREHGCPRLCLSMVACVFPIQFRCSIEAKQTASVVHPGSYIIYKTDYIQPLSSSPSYSLARQSKEWRSSTLRFLPSRSRPANLHAFASDRLLLARFLLLTAQFSVASPIMPLITLRRLPGRHPWNIELSCRHWTSQVNTHAAG
jgi:hypothetical protein